MEPMIVTIECPIRSTQAGATPDYISQTPTRGETNLIPWNQDHSTPDPEPKNYA